MRKSIVFNRRSFLQISALAGGGLLVSITLPAGARPLDSNPLNESPSVLNPFLKIGPDNSIYIISSRVEMGQGVWTTLPMLIAEELDCDWKKIKVEHSPAGGVNDFVNAPILSSTGGSTSTILEFDRYRTAGATARMMLVNAAAKRLGVSPKDCITADGYVLSGERRISYGEVATEASSLSVPSVTLRDAKDWKYIGKSQKRLDGKEKICGKTIYGIDIQANNLLTTVVAHAPVFGGKVKSYKSDKAKLIDGVLDVIEIPTGIAVIAENFWAAKKGRDALSIEWDNGVNEDIDSEKLFEEYSRLSKTEGLIIRQSGDVVSALESADKKLDAEFRFPYLAHAPMEPLNCTVKIGPDSCEIWVGTQSPLLHQAEVAAFLGIQPERVVFHTPHLGGSFGRRGSFSGDWMMEAVHIAKLSGRFIKLIWTREDDIQGGYYRPLYVHHVEAAIDTTGFPVAWRHRIVGQSLFVNTPLEKMIVHNGIDYSCVTTGAPYSNAIPDHSFQLHTTSVGVPVLAWRSVGSTHTAFVMETMIDELAALASLDPVDYRRTLLKGHSRHLGVLNLAVEKAEWRKPLPASVFRGIAVGEAMDSYICQIVELSIEDQKIRIHRVVCAIDCGIAVNPDGVRAQMEGGIIFGLTAALYGEITIEKGRPRQRNFNDYRMVRMNDAPEIEVYIVESTEKMGGAGEPGVPFVAPALANALFAATGKRLRRLPFRSADWS